MNEEIDNKIKYKKVTDEQVLNMYAILCRNLWNFPHIPIELVADRLHTSVYQVRKAYHNLEKLGYMEKVEVPTMTEEYDNGLYTETVVVLKTKAFNITKKGQEKVGVKIYE